VESRTCKNYPSATGLAASFSQLGAGKRAQAPLDEVNAVRGLLRVGTVPALWLSESHFRADCETR